MDAADDARTPTEPPIRSEDSPVGVERFDGPGELGSPTEGEAADGFAVAPEAGLPSPEGADPEGADPGLPEAVERRRRGGLGLDTKLTLAALLPALVMALATVAAAYWTQRTSIWDQRGQLASALAQGLAASAEDLLATRDAAALQMRLEQTLASPDLGGAYALVIDDRGRPTAHGFAPTVPEPLLEPGAAAGSAHPTAPRERRYPDPVTGVERRAIEVDAPITAGTGGTVRVGVGVDDLERAALLASRHVAMAAAGGLLLVWLLAARAGRRTVQPIRRLVAITDGLTRDQLDALAPVASRDELGLLTETVNEAVLHLRQGRPEGGPALGFEPAAEPHGARPAMAEGLARSTAEDGADGRATLPVEPMSIVDPSEVPELPEEPPGELPATVHEGTLDVSPEAVPETAPELVPEAAPPSADPQAAGSGPFELPAFPPAVDEPEPAPPVPAPQLAPAARPAGDPPKEDAPGPEVAELLAQARTIANEGAQILAGGEAAAVEARGQVQVAEKALERVGAVDQTVAAWVDDCRRAGASAAEARQAAESGQQELTVALERLRAMQSGVGGLAEKVKGVAERAMEIMEAAETLAHVSTQTHLLSLNAAIEATSAGDHGVRFGVVATEMRELSTEVARVSREVGERVRAIRDDVQHAVAAVEGGSEGMRSGLEVVGGMGQSLAALGTWVERASDLSQRLEEGAPRVSTGVRELRESLVAVGDGARRLEAALGEDRARAEAIQRIGGEQVETLERFRGESAPTPAAPADDPDHPSVPDSHSG